MKKTILISVGLIILALIAIQIYFVSGVSAVNPPIKEYSYRGTVKKFVEEI